MPQTIIEIQASELKSNPLPYPHSIKIIGDVPRGRKIQVVHGDIIVEGNVADRVAFECDGMISIKGDVKVACLFSGEAIHITGDLQPGTFKATASFKVEGNIEFSRLDKSSTGESKLYKLIVLKHPREIFPNSLLEYVISQDSVTPTDTSKRSIPSVTPTNRNKRSAPAAFFQSEQKKLMVRKPEQKKTPLERLAITSAAGTLNDFSYPKNIPTKFEEWLPQGLLHLYKTLHGWHEELNTQQKPEFIFQNKKGKTKKFEIHPLQLQPLTEFCNALMKEDLANLQDITKSFSPVFPIATGVGKTFLFILIIYLLTIKSIKENKQLQFHTLIVSPLLKIKEQSNNSFQDYARELSVEEFDINSYKATKQLRSTILTTTYQALKKHYKDLDLSSFHMIVFDEADDGLLSELRGVPMMHEMLQQTPLFNFLLTATPYGSKRSVFDVVGYANPGDPSSVKKINPISTINVVQAIEGGRLAPVKTVCVHVQLDQETQAQFNGMTEEQVEGEGAIPFLDDPRMLKMLVYLILNGKVQGTNQRFLGLYGLIRSRNKENTKKIVEIIQQYISDDNPVVAEIIAPIKARFEKKLNKRIEKEQAKAAGYNPPKKFDETAFRKKYKFKIVAAINSDSKNLKVLYELREMGGILLTVGRKMIGRGDNFPPYAILYAYDPTYVLSLVEQFGGRIMRLFRKKDFEKLFAIQVEFNYGNNELQKYYVNLLQGLNQVGIPENLPVVKDFKEIPVDGAASYTMDWEHGTTLQISSKANSKKNTSPQERHRRIKEKEINLEKDLIALEEIFRKYQDLIAEQLPQIQIKPAPAPRRSGTQQSQAQPAAENSQTQAPQENPPTIESTTESSDSDIHISSALFKRVKTLMELVDNLWDTMKVESTETDEDEMEQETTENETAPASSQTRIPNRKHPLLLFRQQIHGLKERLSNFLDSFQGGATKPQSDNNNDEMLLETEGIQQDAQGEAEDILNDILKTMRDISLDWNNEQLQNLVQRTAALQPQVTAQTASAQTNAMEVESIATNNSETEKPQQENISQSPKEIAVDEISIANQMELTDIDIAELKKLLPNKEIESSVSYSTNTSQDIYADEIKSSIKIANCKIIYRNLEGITARNLFLENVYLENINFNNADLQGLKMSNVNIDVCSFNGANMMFVELNETSLDNAPIKDTLMLGAYCKSGFFTLTTLKEHGAILTISDLIQRTTEMFANPSTADPNNRRKDFLEILTKIADKKYPKLQCSTEEEIQIDELLFKYKAQSVINNFEKLYLLPNYNRRIFYNITFPEGDYTTEDFSNALFFYCNLQNLKVVQAGNWRNNIFLGCRGFNEKIDQLLPRKTDHILPKGCTVFESVIDLIKYLSTSLFPFSDISKRLTIFSRIYLSHSELYSREPEAAKKLQEYLQKTTETKSLTQQSAPPKKQEKITQIKFEDFYLLFTEFKSELAKRKAIDTFQDYVRKKGNLESNTCLALDKETIADKDLSNIDMTLMKVQDTSFTNVNFSNVKASRSIFQNVYLKDCNLTQANFSVTRWIGVKLEGAASPNMENMDFSNGLFFLADFTNTTRLIYANFSNSILFMCKFPSNAPLIGDNVLVAKTINELFELYQRERIKLFTLKGTQQNYFFHKELPAKIKVQEQINAQFVTLAKYLDASESYRGALSEEEKQKLNSIISGGVIPPIKEESSLVLQL